MKIFFFIILIFILSSCDNNADIISKIGDQSIKKAIQLKGTNKALGIINKEAKNIVKLTEETKGNITSEKNTVIKERSKKEETKILANKKSVITSKTDEESKSRQNFSVAKTRKKSSTQNIKISSVKTKTPTQTKTVVKTTQSNEQDRLLREKQAALKKLEEARKKAELAKQKEAKQKARTTSSAS